MSSLLRKMKRNQLKRKLGNNKIRDAFHQENDTLIQKINKINKEKEK